MSNVTKVACRWFEGVENTYQFSKEAVRNGSL